MPPCTRLKSARDNAHAAQQTTHRLFERGFQFLRPRLIRLHKSVTSVSNVHQQAAGMRTTLRASSNAFHSAPRSRAIDVTSAPAHHCDTREPSAGLCPGLHLAPGLLALTSARRSAQNKKYAPGGRFSGPAGGTTASPTPPSLSPSSITTTCPDNEGPSTCVATRQLSGSAGVSTQSPASRRGRSAQDGLACPRGRRFLGAESPQKIAFTRQPAAADSDSDDPTCP